jgi:hypothetical protein
MDYEALAVLGERESVCEPVSLEVRTGSGSDRVNVQAISIAAWHDPVATAPGSDSNATRLPVSSRRSLRLDRAQADSR